MHVLQSVLIQIGKSMFCYNEKNSYSVSQNVGCEVTLVVKLHSQYTITYIYSDGLARMVVSCLIVRVLPRLTSNTIGYN